MKAIILYVLKGDNGKRYVGITNNLKRRIGEHTRRETKGGQILGEEFKLLLTETYPDYKTAREREKFLKSGQGRKLLSELEIKTRIAKGD